ncbi:hypothetical protein C8R31_101650 [Nitrosospira sp. Nsp2]|uniref:hypothetical protein n=1 Tax=Nitrosospira sp. Nsp2 TaxID=136548 RepID=UPI000D3121B8|nr:hypothetical protein [Nitrosospira sp. Nsp2]PTR17486.1 hypothetical protein C8R31_101650 [Nitrosospira sp. Nsp2]
MVSESKYVSLREFSRRLNVRLSAVQKAIASGRVTSVKRGHGGRLCGVDPELGLQEWARNTDPCEAAKSGKVIEAPAAPQLMFEVQTSAQSNPDSLPPTEPAAPGYQDHRTKREKHLADIAELEYLERVGQLVSAKEVERETMSIFSLLKISMFRIIDRKAQQLATETDPARIERLLRAEFTQVFDECSRELDTSTAEGTEERPATMP